jgi:hypothetical protein
VASNGELRIFGPTDEQASASASLAAAASSKSSRQAGPSSPAAPADTYSGSIIRVEGTQLWLNTRQQGILQVDTTKARQAGLSVHLEPGQPVTVRGSVTGNVIDAKSIHYGLSTR